MTNLQTTISISISTMIMVEILSIFNQEASIGFRVEGGAQFGGKKGDPKQGAFCHMKASRLHPYLIWNGETDYYNYGGHGAAGYLLVLYSENYIDPTESMKTNDSPIDEGEKVAKDYEVLWKSPLLWLGKDTVRSQISVQTYVDWGALIRY